MAKSETQLLAERAGESAIASFGSRTDVGCVRQQNEDSLIVAPPLFVVADGMGGHAAGEVASEIAVKTISELVSTHADAEELGRAVEQANRDIITAAVEGEGREGMGTTCTAAILEGTRLVIAQVGDSRAYLLHDKKLSQLTRDHSLMANMIEAGQITPEEARVHPSRSVITRALGNDPETIPDLYEINVEDGDRLLLCSDGLTSMLEDAEIQAVMNRISDPQMCADVLVDGALAAGGLDNVTVVIANVEGDRKQARRTISVRTRLTALILLLLLVLCIGGAAWGGSAYLHHTAYLAQSEQGTVAVYRGVPGSVLGFRYSELVENTEIPVGELSQSAAESIRSEKGMRVSSVEEALALVDTYRAEIEEKKAKEQSRSSSASSARSQSSANGEDYEKDLTYDEGEEELDAYAEDDEAYSEEESDAAGTSGSGSAESEGRTR